jgi:hypothetical protein
LSAPANAQTVATKPDIALPASCGFSQPARMITSLKDAPTIAAAFKGAKLDMADAGEPYIPYDSEDEKSRGLPHRQFLRAYEFERRTVVWYYHGGFVTHVHVVELAKQLDDKGRVATVLGLRGNVNVSGPPCKATQALLDGVVGMDDW